jgi:hypothetical protein
MNNYEHVSDAFEYILKKHLKENRFYYGQNFKDFHVEKPPRVCENLAEKEEIERMFYWIHTSVEKFLGRFEPSGINRKGVLVCCSVLTVRRVFVATSPQVLMKYLRVMVKKGWVREYRDEKGFPSFVPVEYDKLNYKSQFDS